MNKEFVILVLKIVVAVATAILGILGASSLSSCSAYRTVESQGKTVIVITDTTTVDHRGNYNLKIR